MILFFGGGSDLNFKQGVRWVLEGVLEKTRVAFFWKTETERRYSGETDRKWRRKFGGPYLDRKPAKLSKSTGRSTSGTRRSSYDTCRMTRVVPVFLCIFLIGSRTRFSPPDAPRRTRVPPCRRRDRTAPGEGARKPGKKKPKTEIPLDSHRITKFLPPTTANQEGFFFLFGAVGRSFGRNAEKSASPTNFATNDGGGGGFGDGVSRYAHYGDLRFTGGPPCRSRRVWCCAPNAGPFLDSAPRSAQPPPTTTTTERRKTRRAVRVRPGRGRGRQHRGQRARCVRLTPYPFYSYSKS